MALVVVGLGVGCPALAASKAPRRSEPVCAVQDCKTKKIVDNGCSDDGRCAACVNACPQDLPPLPPVGDGGP
jgi:hypothetical protein